jgi:hypothetical protein
VALSLGLRHASWRLSKFSRSQTNLAQHHAADCSLVALVADVIGYGSVSGQMKVVKVMWLMLSCGFDSCIRSSLQQADLLRSSRCDFCSRYIYGISTVLLTRFMQTAANHYPMGVWLLGEKRSYGRIWVWLLPTSHSWCPTSARIPVSKIRMTTDRDENESRMR